MYISFTSCQLLSKSWSFPLFRVTVTCGLGDGSKKGEQGKRTSRVKQAKDRRELRKAGVRGRGELSRHGKRRLRRGRREVMRRRRRRDNCSPITHTFTRPHQDNWPELPVWEHWCQYWCCYRIKNSSSCSSCRGTEGIIGGKKTVSIRSRFRSGPRQLGVGWVAWPLLDRWFGKPDSAFAMLT